MTTYNFTLQSVKVKAAQLCPTPCNPMDFIVHGILQARILEWVAFLFSEIFPTQIEPRSPTLQVDSLPAEPQGKPKNLFQLVFKIASC